MNAKLPMVLARLGRGPVGMQQLTSGSCMGCRMHRYPGLVPHVVAQEPARGWFLQQGAAGVHLHHNDDLSEWERALTAYAAMQVDLAGVSSHLAQLGCPDRRPEERGPLPAGAAAVPRGHPPDRVPRFNPS